MDWGLTFWFSFSKVHSSRSYHIVTISFVLKWTTLLSYSISHVTSNYGWHDPPFYGIHRQVTCVVRLKLHNFSKLRNACIGIASCVVVSMHETQQHLSSLIDIVFCLVIKKSTWTSTSIIYASHFIWLLCLKKIQLIFLSFWNLGKKLLRKKKRENWRTRSYNDEKKRKRKKSKLVGWSRVLASVWVPMITFIYLTSSGAFHIFTFQEYACNFQSFG